MLRAVLIITLSSSGLSFPRPIVVTAESVRSTESGVASQATPGYDAGVKEHLPVRSQRQVTKGEDSQSKPGAIVEGEYACSMHPSVRSNAKGKCPKCGMELIPVLPEVADDFDLKMEVSPAAPKPNEKMKLKFRILNPKTGVLVKDFGLLHEKKLHLFIISQDLTQFQHIHPAYNNDGSFAIETSLPLRGHYKIYTDFYPLAGTPQVLQRSITTVDFKTDLSAGIPSIKPDAILTKICEGEKITKENAERLGVEFSSLKAKTLNNLKVELKLEPPEIVTGYPTHLVYHLTDAKTGEPIKDLSPYLGSFGHALILSKDQIEYIHSHSEELPPDPLDPDIIDESLFLAGPRVTFEALFPHPGIFRIWAQFLRGDTLTTVTFTVEAKRMK
ncbi:MAG: heavy metal-binding domain-containing protein [Acidobacteriota bacterium]